MKNKYGTYKLTKKGLVKEEERPIRITFADGTKTTIYPTHDLYGTIDFYHDKDLKEAL